MSKTTKNNRLMLYDDKVYKEEVNQENKYVLEDYIIEMESRGLSEQTINQYVSDIKGFYCWAVENADNKYILEMEYRVFRDFFVMFRRNNTSSSRINRVQCSLRNMLDYCYRDTDLYDYPENVMDRVEGLENNPVREIQFLTDEEVTFLIDYLVEKDDLQRATYISLAYDSVGRRNEIHQVTKHSFLDPDQNVTNEVVGKRSKRFALLYMDRTKELATEYLKSRGDDNVDSMWIVRDADGVPRQASYDTLYQWVISLRDVLESETGERKKFNAHSFRHSGIENYENGTHYNLEALGHDNIPLDVLQILANHEDIKTTQGYIKDRGKEQLFNMFGVGDDEKEPNALGL